MRSAKFVPRRHSHCQVELASKEFDVLVFLYCFITVKAKCLLNCFPQCYFACGVCIWELPTATNRLA